MTYDMRQRGVCVISGRNEDDAGAVSNGAGKSALAMSALWAVTGRSDARIEVGQEDSRVRRGVAQSSECCWQAAGNHLLPLQTAVRACAAVQPACCAVLCTGK